MLCSPSRPYAHPHPQPPSPEAGKPEMAAFLGEVPASASRGHCESVLLVSLFEKRPPSPRNARLPPPFVAHIPMALSLRSTGELTQLLGFSIRRLADCGALFVLCSRHSKPRQCPCLWLKTQSPESCPVPPSFPAGGGGDGPRPLWKVGSGEGPSQWLFQDGSSFQLYHSQDHCAEVF